ncbi:uncharacterized protein LOC111138189 [Crassostrea virginica]|uniref:Uncharacterized protein LOC111138189 n=1 Tax=Crassostrea virginica TaxID=6565 RepID=A0A8B8F1S0_CRAVI|nr:uncharacterized protein LOC111138189 [Crassostrea virginica]
MYFTQPLLLLLIPLTVCIVSCTFVQVTRQPYLSMAWAYKYDPGQGIAAMRSNFNPTPNDTCHVYKLTDQERHDIHTMSGEFKVEIMMYEAILTQHGEPMTAQELNHTSYYAWKFCEHQRNFMKYNFYQ